MALHRAHWDSNRRRSGFTLLEVMVSMAILATALVILLEGHGSSVRLSESSRKLTIATALARDVMTEFALLGYPTPGSDSGDFEEWYPEMYPDYRWEIEIQESMFWSYVREAYVKVIWQESGQDRNVEIVQFFAAMNKDEQEQAEMESSGSSNLTEEGVAGAFESAAGKTKGGGGLFGSN